MSSPERQLLIISMQDFLDMIGKYLIVLMGDDFIIEVSVVDGILLKGHLDNNWMNILLIHIKIHHFP